MVAVKGRMNTLKDRAAQDQKISNRIGQVKNFKIYAEVDKDKIGGSGSTKGKSILPNVGSQLNVSDSKSNIMDSEKIKSKPDKSMTINVGRKVLADISNVKGRFTRTEQGKFSRLRCDDASLYGRNNTSEKMLYPQSHRCREETSNMEATSSDKPSTGRMRLEISKSSGEKKTLKKLVATSRNVNATSDEPKTKFQGRNSATATGRASFRNPLHLTRNSLPALKVDQENPGKSEKFKGKHGFPVVATSRNLKGTSDEPKTKFQVRNSATATGRASFRNPLHLTRNSLPALKVGQENPGKSEKFKGKHGFPVKSSAQRSIIPKPSNLSSSHPSGNNVSDGLVLAAKTKSKVEPKVLARRSVRLAVKTTRTTLDYQEKSKPNMFALKKLRPDPVALTKNKMDKVSLCKDFLTVFQEEPAPEEIVSAGTSSAGSTTSEIIARRKSDRRNSYTRLLISRTKECSKVKSPETLPNIYDHHNHLEVSDYVDDIYQYYWFMEAQNPLLKNYMEMQRDILPQMRGILINWLVEVHLKFELMEETLFLTITLLDRYLSLESIKKNEMQLVGLTALFLASKYEDFWHPRVADLVSISAESYTRDQMLQMEKTMVRKLQFRLNEPTLYVFMLRFLKAAQSDVKFEHLAFYLIELCLVEYEALNYKPSMLCASAVYVARCTMRMAPPWTLLLAKHARYEESQIRECAEMIMKFHKAAKTSLLKVTYEKYMKLDRGRVANIKPLDRLPL